MIYFCTKFSMHDFMDNDPDEQKEFSDITVDGNILDDEHQGHCLKPTKFLQFNGSKISFIHYYAHMWDHRFKALSKEVVEDFFQKKILVSNNVLHLSIIRLYLHRLSIGTAILGSTVAFDQIAARAKVEKDFSKIEAFVPGYNFEDGFWDDYKEGKSHSKTEVIKDSGPSGPPPEKPKKSKPVEVVPIQDKQKEYCTAMTNQNNCCTEKCFIFNCRLCGLNFEKVDPNIYLDRCINAEESIKAFLQPSFI